MRRKRRTTFLLGLCALAVFAAGCVPAPPPGPQPPTIILYGDSIVSESRDVLTQQIAAVRPGYRVIVRAVSAAAVCSFFSFMYGEDASAGAQLVVLAFAGSPLPPCMLGQVYKEKWFLDLHQATDIWRGRGVKVLLVADPGGTGATPTAGSIGPRVIAAIDQGIVNQDADPLVRYTDTGPGWLDSTGTYAKRLPCLPDEDATKGCDGSGMIQVRNDDTLHLCLQSGLGAQQACPEYASGIRRYADAIAGAIRAWG